MRDRWPQQRDGRTRLSALSASPTSTRHGPKGYAISAPRQPTAIVIQQSMVGRNAALPREQWIQYRIDVNLGDVIVEPDDIDYRTVLDIAMPYLGPVVGVYSDWTPLQNRGKLYPEDVDWDDPWQFKNFRVV